ncbi:MAG: VanZ family protein [Deltaproteobacteria bacterium]|nr:VanZ family protein [Deltaproteobacteria bacterium]
MSDRRDAAIASTGHPCYRIAMQLWTNPLTSHLRAPGLWLSACLLEALAIFILSVIPSVGGDINSGTLSHCLAYGTLSCITGMYLNLKEVPRCLIKGALLAALYGACMELIQYFIPYRTCQFGDIVVNCLAALAGMAPAALLRAVLAAQQQPPA